MYPDGFWGKKLRDDVEEVNVSLDICVPVGWFRGGDFRGAVKLVQEMASREVESQLWDELLVDEERTTENAK